MTGRDQTAAHQASERLLDMMCDAAKKARTQRLTWAQSYRDAAQAARTEGSFACASDYDRVADDLERGSDVL